MKPSDGIRSAVQLIKDAILQSQARAVQMINQEQLSLYYGIGRYVSEHSRKGFWGTGAIGTISKQLKSELPGLKGFSEENIKLMRRFYEAWKDIEANSVVGTTEITDFNKSGLSGNSVVGTTELKKADSEAESIRQLQFTRDDSFQDNLPHTFVFLTMMRNCQVRIRQWESSSAKRLTKLTWSMYYKIM